MRLLSQPDGVRFSNKEMIAFFLPVFFEQLIVAGLGVADTFMVSNRLGETALAGVALVNRIDNFAKNFFVALAQGGSVVLAQYIGAEDRKNGEKSLKANLQIVVCIGLVFMLAMLVFKKQFVMLFFGGAEKDVLSVSLEYFSITAMSYPFVALYYGANSLFRVMGNSRITFVSSVIMMLINLVIKYIFIFQMDMGVMGAGLSTLIAMAVIGIILTFRLTSHDNKISLSKPLKPEFDRKMSLRILKVSIPNGIEQGMFQFGALILAGLVSGLGKDAINADQIARNLSPLLHGISSGFNALVLTVVGQCIGAKDYPEAIRYKKHIKKMNHLFVAAMAIVFIPLTKPLVSIFGVSAESEASAIQILVIYTLGSVLFYPSAFATPSALRGAGDTRFVMVVSASSMFVFRVGLAYLLVHVFDIGVIAIWIVMVSDWVVRSIIFELRFRHGKWRRKKVI